MNVTVVLGTARKERKSERVYKALLKAFEATEGVETTGVDVRDHVTISETVPPYGVGGTDESPTAWKDIVKKTDIFIFVIPEYNRSFPGEWKLLVDTLYKEYTGKQAYVVGVSGGRFAGARMAELIKPTMIELNFDLKKGGLLVGNVKDVLDEEGNVLDEAFGTQLQKFVDRIAKEA